MLSNVANLWSKLFYSLVSFKEGTTKQDRLESWLQKNPGKTACSFFWTLLTSSLEPGYWLVPLYGRGQGNLEVTPSTITKPFLIFTWHNNCKNPFTMMARKFEKPQKVTRCFNLIFSFFNLILQLSKTQSKIFVNKQTRSRGHYWPKNHLMYQDKEKLLVLNVDPVD